MRIIFLFLLIPSLIFSQNSSVLKSAAKYMPSLSEIGFVTGAINCYVQTSSLVRAVNKEIALAKSMSGRLDNLKNQTEEMYGDFKSLRDINPYNMDSWASWLDRANGLVSDETNDFVDILFNSVLKTLDERMTTGFYDDVKRGLSYDTRMGNIKEVLREYYMGREYHDNMEKIREIAVISFRVAIVVKRGLLSVVNTKLAKPFPPDKPALLLKKAALEKQITDLESEISSPSAGGSTVDKQIAFLMDVSSSIGGDFEGISTQLEGHAKDIRALNDEWVMASKNKLPKDKNTTGKNTPTPITRAAYDPKDADKTPSPINDPDKPTKFNVSHTGSPTSLADMAQLQNKIEFKRLEMAQNALQMELSVANSRAALLSVEAYQAEALRNTRTNTTFGSENLANAIESIRKERGL